ncbi:MAG: hypothetical protein ACYCVB_01460 [Bacilli bacterium]
MIELTRRSKVIAVSALSVLLLASIVFAGVLIDQSIRNAAAAVTRFQSMSAAWLGGNWSGGNSWFAGSVLARQTHTAALSLPKGSQFSFSAPMGNIHVVPATGKRVLVTTIVTMAGGTLAQAKQRAAQVSLTPQSIGSSFSVVVSAPDGRALRGLETTVAVPQGMAVTLVNHLGNVDVAGRFARLSVRVNLGNCTANVKVSGATDIVDDLGNIALSGTLGRTTTISDHMGNIAVYVSGKRTLATTIATNLGAMKVTGASGNAFSRLGNTWTGNIGAGPAKGILNVSDNLGNVTLSEVNAS